MICGRAFAAKRRALPFFFCGLRIKIAFPGSDPTIAFCGRARALSAHPFVCRFRAFRLLARGGIAERRCVRADIWGDRGQVSKSTTYGVIFRGATTKNVKKTLK